MIKNLILATDYNVVAPPLMPDVLYKQVRLLSLAARAVLIKVSTIVVAINYKLVLDMTQAELGEVIYLDDVPVFVSAAESLGIRAICQTNSETTCKELQSFEFETTL